MNNLSTAVASEPAYTQQAPVREPAQAIPFQADLANESAKADVPAPPATPDQADFRLVIEEDEATGAFIYKTMDRRTGEVIQQFPREQLLHLKEATDYAAGAIVNARA